jgi:SAM-dependent methyltransferase
MDFWTEHAQEYADLAHPSLRFVLHPLLRDIVAQSRSAVVLDYGCGDGRFLELLNFVKDRYGYDPSPVMRLLAKKRLGADLTNIYAETGDIPAGLFDAVICSLVLMTISQRTRFVSVLGDITRCVRPGGTVIIAVTHPCFRSYKFSDFDAEYCDGVPFDYFAEGRPFTVTLHDADHHKSLAIRDFHWSLGFTLNRILDAGLSITKIEEPRDYVSSPISTDLVPPFLIIMCSKSSHHLAETHTEAIG